jgi:SAM-dependent methyltransferase
VAHAAPDDAIARAPDGLPIPPDKLIELVAGTADITWFLEGGRRGAETITEMLERAGVRVADLRKILDFGCGCGRVIRHFHTLANTRLYGVDYNSELVAWCGRNLPFASFETNDLGGSLPYAGNKFDLIYALSVFTHLSETLQFHWIGELCRVLKPNGYLLLTTHGESYVDIIGAAGRERFQSGQLVVISDSESGANECSAFHPAAYVREKLARGFEVVDFVPEGAKGNPHQDAFLLRKLP